MPNIFRTGTPTNFKLGRHTEHDDPHQRQASKVKGRGRKVVMCLTGVGP